jgi:hypothetical protein
VEITVLKQINSESLKVTEIFKVRCNGNKGGKADVRYMQTPCLTHCVGIRVMPKHHYLPETKTW